MFSTQYKPSKQSQTDYCEAAEGCVKFAWHITNLHFKDRERKCCVIALITGTHRKTLRLRLGDKLSSSCRSFQFGCIYSWSVSTQVWNEENRHPVRDSYPVTELCVQDMQVCNVRYKRYASSSVTDYVSITFMTPDSAYSRIFFFPVPQHFSSYLYTVNQFKLVKLKNLMCTLVEWWIQSRTNGVNWTWGNFQ